MFGRLISSGGLFLIGVSGFFLVLLMCGIVLRRLMEYGMWVWWKSLCMGVCFIGLLVYMIMMLFVVWVIIFMLCVIIMIVVLVFVCVFLIRLRIWVWIVMFRVVVGLLVMISLGLFVIVIVIMMCCCMLLENLCGKVFICFFGLGMFMSLRRLIV